MIVLVWIHEEVGGVGVSYICTLGINDWSFYATGGRGLVRIIPNYLFAAIPDKKYSWSDFVPNHNNKR